MAKNYSIPFSRKQLILLSWLCSSCMDFVLSFHFLDKDFDTSEILDLRNYLDSFISQSFKFD